MVVCDGDENEDSALKARNDALESMQLPEGISDDEEKDEEEDEYVRNLDDIPGAPGCFTFNVTF